MTGITGLVGSAVAVELLRRRPADEIVAVCRTAGGATGRERMEHAIREQCAFDGVSGVEGVLGRITAVEGALEDLPAARLASDGPYDACFHCAANVYLGKDAEGDTDATNRGGTAAILALARNLGIPSFHYVSTSYVCGTATGRMMEGPSPAVGFNNAYERSKFGAERLVRTAGLPFTIYRPSIIVGRLSDGALRKPLAFYRFLEFMGRLKRRACCRLHMAPSAAIDTPFRMAAPDSDALSFVPVDHVQRVIAALVPRPCRNETYHVTGESPVRQRDAVAAFHDVLGLRGFAVQPEVDGPSPAERLLVEVGGGLLPYFSAQAVFDDTNVRRDLGAESVAWKLDAAAIRRMMLWYYFRTAPDLVMP